MPVSKDAVLIALATAGLISISVQVRAAGKLFGCSGQGRSDVMQLYIFAQLLFQVVQVLQRWRRGEELFTSWAVPDGRWREIADGIEGLIGDTPLVRIRSLSEQTGCEVSPSFLCMCRASSAYFPNSTTVPEKCAVNFQCCGIRSWQRQRC